VALQAGTVQEALVAAGQPGCGPRPITARAFESGTQVILEVMYRRADAALTDFPVGVYNAKVSGGGRDVEVVGQQLDPGPYGIGVRKQDAQLRSVLQAALRQAIADRSYDRVLARWNVTDGALRTARLVGAGS
jgi:polar amino acid transport system substrate-binding protein